MSGLRMLVGVLLLAGLSGCASVISKEVRSEATPLESFAELRNEPERFQGKTVILGGEIVETRNRADATTLVVLEKPLNGSDRPKDTDASGGRFLARFSEYLDPVVFAVGRKVTIAGTVTGVETENVGETPYRYVVIRGREVHLWPKYPPAPPGYYGPPWYDPWYPYYPWPYDPYWGRRPWW